MKVTDNSIECRELFIVDIDGNLEREDVCFSVFSCFIIHLSSGKCGLKKKKVQLLISSSLNSVASACIPSFVFFLFFPSQTSSRICKINARTLLSIGRGKEKTTKSHTPTGSFLQLFFIDHTQYSVVNNSPSVSRLQVGRPRSVRPEISL